MTGNTVEIDADIAVMVKMLIFEGKNRTGSSEFCKEITARSLKTLTGMDLKSSY